MNKNYSSITDPKLKFSNGSVLLDFSSDSNNYDQQRFFWAELLSLSCLNVLVIAGNTIVGLAPLINGRLRSPSHYFIASLAAADFALGVFVIPFAISAQLTPGGHWLFGVRACQLWQTLDVFLSTASIYSLIAITFDRFVAVTDPLKYRSRMTPRACCLLIFLVWFASLCVCTPSLPLAWPRIETTLKIVGRCTPASNGSIFIIYSAIGSFYLPMIVIVYLYARIYATVRKIRMNSTSGIVNIGRRATSATTTTAASTGHGHRHVGCCPAGTAGESEFFDATTTLGVKIQIPSPPVLDDDQTLLNQEEAEEDQEQELTDNGMIMMINRCQNRNRSVKCQNSVPDERTSLLTPPSLADHHARRRSSEGPMLRIHKGRYHPGRRLSNGKRRQRVANGQISTPPIVIVDSASTVTVSSIKSNKSHRSIIGLGGGGTNSTPPLSPMAIVRRLHKSETVESEKTRDSTDAEDPSVPQDFWLRLALPSQIVTAWAQRMMALHRYRRKLSLEIRALKTVVLVTGCFFVCWTGFCVVYTMRAFDGDMTVNDMSNSSNADDKLLLISSRNDNGSCVPDWLFNLMIWFGYANSAANPIIYGIANVQFRRTFRRFVRCEKLRAAIFSVMVLRRRSPYTTAV